MTNDKGNPRVQEIKEQSRFYEDGDYVNSCLLRDCFDPASSEWNHSTMDEKVEALSVLINRDDKNTLGLALGMLDYCNKEANKGINMIDLVISMSKIIDHLLKNEK